MIAGFPVHRNPCQRKWTVACSDIDTCSHRCSTALPTNLPDLQNRSLTLCRRKSDDALRLAGSFPFRALQKAGGELSSIRVLVVEDFLPFRRFICSTLEQRGDLQVVCEVSDGLEAVHKAEELKPDLILLDIGLPTLNGIEAARQIRKTTPGSKILFVTQESSPDVVQAALNSGAQGYVLKARAVIDLLPAVEAVLKGDQFVSSGLKITPDSI